MGRKITRSLSEIKYQNMQTAMMQHTFRILPWYWNKNRVDILRMILDQYPEIQSIHTKKIVSYNPDLFDHYKESIRGKLAMQKLGLYHYKVAIMAHQASNLRTDKRRPVSKKWGRSKSGPVYVKKYFIIECYSNIQVAAMDVFKRRQFELNILHLLEKRTYNDDTFFAFDGWSSRETIGSIQSLKLKNLYFFAPTPKPWGYAHTSGSLVFDRPKNKVISLPVFKCIIPRAMKTAASG